MMDERKIKALIKSQHFLLFFTLCPIINKAIESPLASVSPLHVHHHTGVVLAAPRRQCLACRCCKLLCGHLAHHTAATSKQWWQHLGCAVACRHLCVMVCTCILYVQCACGVTYTPKGTQTSLVLLSVHVCACLCMSFSAYLDGQLGACPPTTSLIPTSNHKAALKPTLVEVLGNCLGCVAVAVVVYMLSICGVYGHVVDTIHVCRRDEVYVHASP